MSRRPRAYESDVLELERRRRDLLAAGDSATEREIARYEADRERLIDLIGDQIREQREYDDAMQRLRAEMDSEGWVSDGDETAHQAPDALAHVNDDPRDARTAVMLDSELREVEDMVNAPYRTADHKRADLEEIDQRIRDVRYDLLVEQGTEHREAGPAAEHRVSDDAGDQR